MQKALLIAAGIECYIKDEHTVTIDPLLSPAIGGMKLMVKPEDVDEATHVLDTAEQAFIETVTCVKCGRQSIQKIVNKKTFDTLWAKLWSILKNGQPAEQKII